MMDQLALQADIEKRGWGWSLHYRRHFRKPGGKYDASIWADHHLSQGTGKTAQEALNQAYQSAIQDKFNEKY